MIICTDGRCDRSKVNERARIVHSESICFNFMMSNFATALGQIVRDPVIAVMEVPPRA